MQMNLNAKPHRKVDMNKAVNTILYYLILYGIIGLYHLSNINGLKCFKLILQKIISEVDKTKTVTGYHKF
jgi:hypothetical protein